MNSVAALPCKIMFHCTAFHLHMYAVLGGLICTISVNRAETTAGIFVRNVLKLFILLNTANW